MRNHDQLPILAAAPAAAKSVTNFDEVQWPLIFVVPAGVSNFLLAGIDQDQASGSEQGLHPSVVQSHVTIQVARGGRAVE